MRLPAAAPGAQTSLRRAALPRLRSGVQGVCGVGWGRAKRKRRNAQGKRRRVSAVA
jgi:hypothetical protein